MEEGRRDLEPGPNSQTDKIGETKSISKNLEIASSACAVVVAVFGVLAGMIYSNHRVFAIWSFLALWVVAGLGICLFWLSKTTGEDPAPQDSTPKPVLFVTQESVSLQSGGMTPDSYKVLFVNAPREKGEMSYDGVLNFTKDPAKPWDWRQSTGGFPSMPVIKLSVFNYSKDPVFNVDLTFRLNFYAGQEMIHDVTPVETYLTKTIHLKKIDPGKDAAFILNMINYTSMWVKIEFRAPVKLTILGKNQSIEVTPDSDSYEKVALTPRIDPHKMVPGQFFIERTKGTTMTPVSVNEDGTITPRDQDHGDKEDKPK